jgi:L-amino acid N-acyltransferase YncA
MGLALICGGRKFDKWLDTVYMQRALGDGDATTF